MLMIKNQSLAVTSRTARNHHEVEERERTTLEPAKVVRLPFRYYQVLSFSSSVPGKSTFTARPLQKRPTQIHQNRGLLNSFGAFQAYYSTALLSDKSSSAISWIGSTQAFLLELVGVIIGPIFDRGYFHTLIYTGTFLIVFGMIMLSLCSAYWQVLLTQGICVGLGGGLVFVPAIAVVTAAFDKKRAIAVGIISSASSIGR